MANFMGSIPSGTLFGSLALYFYAPGGAPDIGAYKAGEITHKWSHVR